MRRTIIVLLVAGFALAGCSSSTESKADAKPSATKTASPSTQFLKAARQIEFNGTPSDADLLVFPKKWCSALDQGHGVQWLFGLTSGGLYPVGEDWGTVKQDADTLLVAGVKAFCPANLADVKDQLRADGSY
jgi:ABC-type glycerol-3-phosphate transport system substrate-binding protein